MSRRALFLPLLILLAGALLYHLVPNPTDGTLTGIVRDNNGPVAGALVRIKGDSLAVRTDAEGRFSLRRQAMPGDHITAWKAGYLIAGVPVDVSPLLLTLPRLPLEDNEEYPWVDPTPDPASKQNCGNCHAAIYDEWKRSGHASSVSNRRFQSLYEDSERTAWSLYHEYPAGTGVCSSCHAPGLSAGDPTFYQLSAGGGVNAPGVHCDYCHKVAGVEEQGKVGITHGRFGLKLLRPTEGQLFFGPLPDVDRGEDSVSRLYRSSRYCASCHEGIVFGVHVYSTYSEWLESPARAAGKQCQDCHMAPTSQMTNIAPGRGGIARDPKTLASHSLFSPSQKEMLQRSIRLNTEIVREPAGVRVNVTIRADDVGHRVPTGFIDRNLVLVVEASAGNEAIQVLEGPTLPALAGLELKGLAGRLFAKQLYDKKGRSPVPFWRAMPNPVDTRLVPGKAEQVSMRFPVSAERVRVRLIHRRFWPEVTQMKGWPDDAILVIDKEWAVGGKP
jgi:hypothetical protein